MQYADDTLIFIPNDFNSLIHAKRVLRWFELISGLKINFYKRSLVGINLETSLVPWIIFEEYGKMKQALESESAWLTNFVDEIRPWNTVDYAIDRLGLDIDHKTNYQLLGGKWNALAKCYRA